MTDGLLRITILSILVLIHTIFVLSLMILYTQLRQLVKYTLKNKMCEEYSRVRMYGNVLVLMAFPVMF